MPQVRIVAKNFMDMVAALPAIKLDKLYDSTFICEAVLRSLSALAKKYVLQMLFIDSSVSAKSMEEWVLADGISKHKVAIDRLLQLRVFLEVNDRKKETSYKLNPKFQCNIQNYLVYGEFGDVGKCRVLTCVQSEKVNYEAFHGSVSSLLVFSQEQYEEFES